MIFTDATTPENQITYANASFLELTGYAESEALGLPFYCLLASHEDRTSYTPAVIAELPRNTVQLSCLRQDRTSFEAAVLVSPVLDHDGVLQQYFVSLVDLTEHFAKRVEDRLREAEIYQHAPGFIAFSEGPDHRFTFANTAYETLVGRRGLVGLRVADTFPELAKQGFIELLDKVYRTGVRTVGKNTPISFRRGPGKPKDTRYLDFIYEAVRDPDGEVIGLFCEGSDITDARAATKKLNDVQAQLMHVSRINAMGTMAATLAHEINQPLAAIANYAAGCVSILAQSDAPDERLHEGLSAIAAASDRAGKIISRLRGLTKRTTPANEIVDLSTALEEAVDLVRAGGCNNVSISLQCMASLSVVGDKIQIQQVMINLLRNACQAAEQGGRAGAVVALTLKKDGKACVEVRDNGPGLPHGQERDIFKWSESSKPDGMGIGLSVSRTIAESHGGEIVVDYTGASGTSFTFSLPELVATEPARPHSS
jgi:two-component system sensor kinase FixL